MYYNAFESNSIELLIESIIIIENDFELLLRKPTIYLYIKHQYYVLDFQSTKKLPIHEPLEKNTILKTITHTFTEYISDNNTVINS